MKTDAQDTAAAPAPVLKGIPSHPTRSSRQVSRLTRLTVVPPTGADAVPSNVVTVAQVCPAYLSMRLLTCAQYI